MTDWISRNAKPIAIVLVAGAAVIGAFELLDAFAASTPAPTAPGEAEMEGLASVAGLIKVMIFLGVGAVIARPIRRRLRPAPV